MARFQLKMPLMPLAGAILASVLVGYAGYRAGLESLGGPRSGFVGAARSDYLRGYVEGSFFIPCAVALISMIFKGRSTRRVLIVYSVAAAVCAVASFASSR
jgi:hypothetical protein